MKTVITESGTVCTCGLLTLFTPVMRVFKSHPIKYTALLCHIIPSIVTRSRCGSCVNILTARFQPVEPNQAVSYSLQHALLLYYASLPIQHMLHAAGESRWGFGNREEVMQKRERDRKQAESQSLALGETSSYLCMQYLCACGACPFPLYTHRAAHGSEAAIVPPAQHLLSNITCCNQKSETPCSRRQWACAPPQLALTLLHSPGLSML